MAKRVGINIGMGRGNRFTAPTAEFTEFVNKYKCVLIAAAMFTFNC